MPWGNFKLNELKLDQRNVRTGLQPDQRAAISALIADQQEKLVNLAIDLLEMGPSPGEPIWVTADPDEPGRHIVLEGNRRVCAMKLMENPALAVDTLVAASFAKLSKEFSAKPRRSLEAQVFPTREDAEPWIERRHMSATSGIGLQPWRSLAKEKLKLEEEGASVRRSLLVLNYLDDGTEAFGQVGAVINAKATTVDRVLNSPAMGDALGISIDKKNRTISFENGDEIAGRRLLRELVTSMADADFTFSKVRDSGDRDAYVRGFSGRGTKAEGAQSASGRATGAISPTKTASTPARTKPLTDPTRQTLAPKGGQRAFNVPGVRLNRMYKECREIRLDGNENAAALLLRVFIELSSEAYLVEKAVQLPAALVSRKGKSSWVEIGVSLSDKVTAVIGLIDTDAQTKQQLKKARVALSSAHTAGSIDTLHAYIHNRDMTPDAASLREAWDTWENYLRMLHSARV